MPDPTPPSTTPEPGASTPPTGTPPAATPPAPAAAEFDPSKLTSEQLTKVLENPELWNTPRIKELREQAAEAKKLKDQQAADQDKNLTEQKKFEELANKRGEENTALKTQLQTLNVNQSLSSLLVKENVVDLDGALKLVDRSKITVNDDGTVDGVDDALKALKADKPYLFGTPGQPSVGTPSNPGAAGAGNGTFKFKESQLTPEFYAAHKDEIDEAGRLGLIEADGSPQR